MSHNEQLLDEILILRCQIGDKDAFAQLIERHQESLRYFICCLLGDSKSTEDVFQNTWLTVLKKICTLKEPSAFSTWLYRIARNYVYKELKQKTKQFSHIDEDLPAPIDEEDGDFLPNDLTRMHECLRKLKLAHKEILVLRFLEQMSYQQISQATDCDLGTVKSRIYYAKQALKREMEK
jgi:RNA polymerase sigma-70 factor, ECF subfamily